MNKDTGKLRELCRGQNRASMRRIRAAYYLGVADALKTATTWELPALLRRQAE